MHSTPKGWDKTRIDDLKEFGVTKFPLPELLAGEYMIDLFFELGATRSNGMGDAATDWDVIWPYAQAKGLDVDDMTILAQMCQGYYRSRQQGENPMNIPPMEQEE